MEDSDYYIFSPYFAGLESEDVSSRNNFLASFINLSENIRKFLTSADTAQKVLQLIDATGLSDESGEALSLIVRQIVTGGLFIGKAPEVIEKKLELDRKSATEIMNRVLNELLAPVIEEVKDIQRERFVSPAPKLQPRPTMPQPPVIPTRPVAPASPAPSPLRPPAPSSMPPPPPPVKSAEPPRKQVANLGYLLGEESSPSPGVNPGNVLNLRDQQK